MAPEVILRTKPSGQEGCAALQIGNEAAQESSEERNDRPGRQNAPVTGAASGIGKALAAAPIARGARVVADIGGQTLAGAAAALGPRAIPMTCDLAEPALAALGLREPD